MPAVAPGAPYADRAVQYCQARDVVCDPTPGGSFLPHLKYAFNGDLNRAATFIADRV